MPIVNEIHVDDVGTRFYGIFRDQDADIVNLATATGVQMIFKHSTVRKVFDAVVVGDGSTGMVEYYTVDGDLSIHGDWKAQGIASFPDGKQWHSDVHKFYVYPNL